MAEAFLEEIYSDAKIMCELRQVVGYARMHDPTHFLQKGNILLAKLCNVCERYVQHDVVKGKELRNQIQEICEIDNDSIVIGDILEHKILPLLEDSMRQWGDICTENDEGDYRFETTVSGFLTLRDLQRKFYLHSTVDPMWEARQLAECIYDSRNKQYSIRGCGLGYLIYQLYEVSNGSVMLNVYEKDARMVQYARQYGVLDWVPEENLKVVVDADPLPFLHSALEEETGVHLFAPGLKSEAEDIRAILETIDMQQNSYYMHKKDNGINYWNNRRVGGRMVSEFDASHLKKDFIVIAGGPSVDDNMEFLRENQGKKTLIAVGTVFKKLLQSNIIPDLVTIQDPDPGVYRQLEGVEEQKVPMLLSTNAYWKIAASYQGDKYFVPMKGMKEINGYPIEQYEDAWSVGETVTNMAIIAAIRFGAKNIYLVGADMSYPGGITHAEGTAQREKRSLKGLVPVEGVDGGTVYAGKIFNVYRKQVEELIKEAPQVSFYNMSQIGAKIAGTKSYAEAVKTLE